MSKFKITVIVVLALLLLAVPSLFWYKTHYSMAVAKAFEVGSAETVPRVLIATQGSAYKDALVAGIVEHLKARSPYIKIIDVSALPVVHEQDWNAIVVIHTWENWQPQADAKLFVASSKQPSKLIVVTTSGSGKEKMPGIDAVSAASVMDDVPKQVGAVSSRLDAMLNAPVP